jgi:tetratricopeptide (TPR) repeat protein
LALLATGRPREAEEPMKAAIQLYIEDNEIAYASVGYRNLADLQFRSSELEVGLESAKKALDFSKKGKHKQFVVWSEAYLGWILHLLGKGEEADKWFSQADELEGNISSNRIYSNPGIQYADFMISMRRIDEAFELTEQNLKVSKRNNFVNSISRCQRCLGAIERVKGNYKESEIHLQKALEVAHKIGTPFLEIDALLEYGRLWLDMGKNKDAVRDANAALKICGRTGFRFYEPGVGIVLGKAYLAEKDPSSSLRMNLEKAEKFAKSAYKKAASMKYRWAEGDAGHLLGEVYLAKADMGEARAHLERAVKCRKEILDPNVEESEKMLEKLL